MSVTKLPSGRWRAQVHQPGKGNVSVSKILGGPGTFATQKEAKRAREQARALVAGGPSDVITLAEWREMWLTDPLYRRPKESTMIHNRERTKAFCKKHGHLPIGAIGDKHVSDWIRGGKNLTTLSALRAMFNDAASAKAGRLVTVNPFAGLGISKTKGNRNTPIPDEATVWALIKAGDEQAGPFFSAWLQVAAFTGMRPGELDALRWENIDFAKRRIHVVEQWSAKTRAFTTPKNGLTRWAPLTEPAQRILKALPEQSPFVFVSMRNTHWTPSSRAAHWKATKASVGFPHTLYVATRHFAGWYMRNVLKLAPEDIAVALGHQDGGYLVRTLYGHLDEDQALDRVVNAYASRGNVEVLPVRRRNAG